MKLLSILLKILLVLTMYFQSWAFQKSDSLLIEKSKNWYTQKLKENSESKEFEAEFNWRWDKAEVLANKEVVVRISRLGENSDLYPYTKLIFSFDKNDTIIHSEILQIELKKIRKGDFNEIVLNRKKEHIEDFSGKLHFMNMYPWSLEKKTEYFHNGFIDKSTEDLEFPTLIDGSNPQMVLHLKHFRRLSGYSIFEFLVKKDGTVDSIRIKSSYYAKKGLDSLVRNINVKDQKIISEFKFKALSRDIWVQCKVYTMYLNNRTGNGLNYEETADHFRNFDYGFEQLHQNELETYFKNKKGRILDYIIINGKVIFAPTYIWGIT